MGTSEKVLETLKKSGKPMKSVELAAATGIDKKEIDKALKDLKKRGIIDCPKACYYAPIK